MNLYIFIVKKTFKKTADRAGYIKEMPSPIHVSNVALVDPIKQVPTRIQYRYLEDGSKVR